MRRPGGVVLVALVSLAGGCAPRVPPMQGSVSALAVRVEPRPDGSLAVHERFDLRPDPSGAIHFTRIVDAPYADGLAVASVAIDGAPRLPGTDGVVVTASGNRVEITWQRASAGAAPERLELALVAKAAVGVSLPRASVQWPVLAPARGFEVDGVVVELVLPAGSAIYEGTGMVEAGWAVERTPTGMRGTKGPVGNAESATLSGVFDFDRRGVSDPVWERNLDRQRQFLPAFVAGALFFFVIGAGTIVILRAQYPSKAVLRRRPDAVVPTDEARAEASRGLLIAGMAGAALAAGCAAVGGTLLAFLGPAVQLIPGSMALVSLFFVAYAGRLR